MIPLGVLLNQAVATSNPLLTDLVAWWSLEEGSGTRYDSHGNLHLNDPTTVTRGTGRVGHSAHFQEGGPGTTDRLSTDKNPLIPAGETPFSFVFWLNPDTVVSGGSMALVSFGRLDQTYFSWNWTTWHIAAKVSFRMHKGGSNTTTVQCTNTTMTAGNWYMVYCEYNPATSLIGISVNNNALQTASLELDAQNLDASWLDLGDVTNSTWDLEGRMDEVAIWNRLLTADERTELYNAGSGISYGDLLDNSLIAKLVSWYTLNETSGSRLDLYGVNDLTSGSASSIAGKQGNAADFNGTSESLHCVSPDGINSGDEDWAVAFWVNLDELTTDIMDHLVSMTDQNVSGNSADGWHVGYRAGAENAFDVTLRVSSTRYNVNASTFGTPSTGTWYFVYAYHDASAKEIGISVNAGTVDSTTYTGTPNTKTARFNIGRWGEAGSFPYWLNGKMDEVAVFRSPLTQTEINWLYNSGSGRGFADLGVAEWDPTKIAGNILWLDAENPGVTALTWDDRSGNDNHFTASQASEFPTISGGVANFNGTSESLKGPSGMCSGMTQGEIFLRQKRYADNSETGSNTGWISFGTHTDSFQDHFTYGLVVYTGFGSTTRKNCGNPAPAINVWHTANIWSASNDWRFNIDGTQIYNTTSNAVAWDSVATIGGSWFNPGGGIWFQGDMQVVLLYNRKLTAWERSRIERYLSRYNG